MQDGLIIASLLVSYAAFSAGPYLVWPSRWNVVGHLQFGLFFVQYLIPLFLTDPFGYVRPSTVRLYTDIMMLGALTYLFALPIGLQSPRLSYSGRTLLRMREGPYRVLFHQRVVAVTFLATLGLLASFLIMGFVPIFASDPMQAKYFHGEYREGYLRAAVILRPSYFLFLCYLPLLTVIAANERKLRYYLLMIVGMTAIIGYLSRGALGAGLIAGVGIIVAAKHGRVVFSSYLTLVVAFIAIGTLGNYLLNAYFALNTATNGAEISEEIAEGAPDVTEGLRFFESFEEGEHFTYGAQFVGGLVPFQGNLANVITLARYNPGFWAQGVLLGTDDQDVIRNVGGGGVRIAVPISGYAAFGWFGVIMMSFCAGFVTGYLVRFAKNYAGRGSIEQSATVIAMYLALASFVMSPHMIMWYQLLGPLALVWLIYPVRFVGGVLSNSTPTEPFDPAFPG